MSNTTTLGQLLRERLSRDASYSDNPNTPSVISFDDIRWIKSLGEEADDASLDMAAVILEKINKQNMSKLSPADLTQVMTVVEVLQNTKWDVNVHHHVTALVQENHTHARYFNSVFRFGREVTSFVNRRFKYDAAQGSYGTTINAQTFEVLNDKMFNAFQDLLYLRPSKMVTSRRSSFYDEWISINTPEFMAKALNEHHGVWRVLADGFVGLNTLGRMHVKRYGDVFKHAKPKRADMMAYWQETVALYNNVDKIFTANRDLYTAETDSVQMQRMRTFWFKQALRNKVTFEDITKEDPQVSNLILQTAALMYINKEHPMIGNFLKTVIPMLRESIDSGLIDKSNYKTVNVQMLTHKIESYDLPDDLCM